MDEENKTRPSKSKLSIRERIVMAYEFCRDHKYAIVIVAGIVVIFSPGNVGTRWGNSAKIKKLEQEKEYYNNKIVISKRNIEDLKSKEMLERYARENYYMKADNEDIFIIDDGDED